MFKFQHRKLESRQEEAIKIHSKKLNILRNTLPIGLKFNINGRRYTIVSTPYKRFINYEVNVLPENSLNCLHYNAEYLFEVINRKQNGI